MLRFKTASTLLATAAVLSLSSLKDAKALDLNTGGPFCSKSDISYILGGNTFNAVACTGSYEGNTNDSNNLDILNSEFEGTWSFNTSNKSDSSGFGVFTSNPNTTTSGTLTFDTAQTGYFAIGLKASNNVSFYLLNGGASGISSFTFNTIGTAQNDKGKAQDLSHAAFYKLESGTPVPTPALLPGLIGMGAAALRKRKGEAEGSEA